MVIFLINQFDYKVMIPLLVIHLVPYCVPSCSSCGTSNHNIWAPTVGALLERPDPSLASCSTDRAQLPRNTATPSIDSFTTPKLRAAASSATAGSLCPYHSVGMAPSCPRMPACLSAIVTFKHTSMPLHGYCHSLFRIKGTERGKWEYKRKKTETN